jgi:hypothetical protein
LWQFKVDPMALVHKQVVVEIFQARPILDHSRVLQAAVVDSRVVLAVDHSRVVLAVDHSQDHFRTQVVEGFQAQDEVA